MIILLGKELISWRRERPEPEHRTLQAEHVLNFQFFCFCVVHKLYNHIQQSVLADYQLGKTK